VSDGWALAAGLILAGQPVDELCCSLADGEQVQDVRRPALYHRDSSVVRHRTSAPLVSRLRIPAYLRAVSGG
jgi:hypothetical protein